MKILIITLLFVLLGTVILETDNQFDVKSDQYSNAINRSVEILNHLRNNWLIPGIVAGVSINGTFVWAQPFGYTDIENDVKTTLDSAFRLASISKSLTSILIGRLVDEGLIDLEKSINKYLHPNVFPVKQWNGKNVTITVEQLMSHTSGLRTMKYPDDLLIKLHHNNVTDSLATLKDLPLLHSPGTSMNYSNYGYQVVGAIIESVLNQTYESAANKMFADLGMNSTFCERREQIIRHRSRYYETVKSTDKKSKLQNTGIFDELMFEEDYWPAGGVISNLQDLHRFGAQVIKWSKGINTTKRFNVSPKTINKIWFPVVDINQAIHLNVTDKYKYAHGWFITEFEKPLYCARCKVSSIKDIKWHSGTLSGLNTYLMLEPENEIVFTLFMNHLAPGISPYSLDEIAQTIFKNFVL